ncbi:transposase InsO family protein [Agrobacterium pusense]|nr:transposase InsO family protein [Agrobacterium pusense]
MDIGMEPCSTPFRNPQSNGMAEAFVKTFKRGYVSVNPLPDAITVIAHFLHSSNTTMPFSHIRHWGIARLVSSKTVKPKPDAVRI